MSQTETTEIVYLEPEEIVIPDVTNVRPWSSRQVDTEKELASLEVLGQTIAEEGQLQPVKVRKNGNEGSSVYELILGRRRVRAIQMYNLNLAKGEKPLKVAAIVAFGPVKDAKAFKQAAWENIHREQLSPMDFASLIKDIRTRSKVFAGSGGTKKVAEFLKVSEATVTQAEKLLELPEELQSKVHSGDLSKDDAFKLVKIAGTQGVQKAVEVMVEAEEAEKQVLSDPSSAVLDNNESNTETVKKTAKNIPSVKKAKAAKSKVIQAAVREASDKPQSRSRKEIIEFFTACYGPMYGHSNGAVHVFVDNFVKFCAGEITERTCYKYWDLMVEKADKGRVEIKSEKKPTELKKKK